MLAQEVFNLPAMPETAPQLGWWGVLIFALFLVGVIVYLVRALPRVGDVRREDDE